ncbi:putative zinc finger protein [Kribbella sp. VKM Ac-2569]|uniref:anti-sigma factor family protein n=1 Tax=Kribbella sp. VKM Ac-2569 TaxID=2512220 RepID=UPI00102C68CD|nr:zf-HC2 domain-containing protein [Kribbella sp. VKM Ac-2569]RZT13542.1 putative zinc finger protein [Kribbella sp. VKM Ac-2569]
MSEHDRTQLGAYALGALEPAEVAAVDEHLATCAECRAELAELTEMKDFLGEVPPEAFLEGPPEGGDLLLQRTLREIREPQRQEPQAKPKRRSRWLLIAAAVVVVAGALGGGVVLGRSTAPDTDQPVAGSKQVTTSDTTTGATMAATVEPRAGWSWVRVQVSGLKAGDQCEMVITDKAGRSWVAGSWLVSEKAAKSGSAFGGGVLTPIDQVRSVEIRTVQGKHVVTATI